MRLPPDTKIIPKATSRQGLGINKYPCPLRSNLGIFIVSVFDLALLADGSRCKRRACSSAGSSPEGSP